MSLEFDVVDTSPARVGLSMVPSIGSEAPAYELTGHWLGKRVFDVTAAVALFVLALPVLFAAALLVRLSSPGPVFFSQRRVGRGGHDFTMLKFRTMRTDSEEVLRSDPAMYASFLEDGHKLATRTDPRVTSVGRVLRRLSVDELPQLLNVLAGHMSMVGPRPVERSQLVRDYGEHKATYVALRPGLTGLWQVSGRSEVRFPERAELDWHYLQSCGPWVDMRILLRTPLVVFAGFGAD